MGCMRVYTQRGQIITGTRSVRYRIISKDKLPEPTMTPARNSVTGTPLSRKASKKITPIVAAFAALVLVTINTLSAAEQKTIVGVAAGAGQFNTLVAAVKAAGLVETLNGKGPFTVFAPTDEAFAKLPAGTVVNLLKPENKEKLVAVLTYHVLPGELMAADVRTTNAKTVNGKKLAIKRCTMAR
jgi:uncharacterized surface protein with fasciclin (FAS1) repeats